MAVATVFAVGSPSNAVAQSVKLPESVHVSAAKAALMSNPPAAYAESKLARSAAEALPESIEKKSALVEADWLEGASLLGLHRAADALSLIERALNRPDIGSSAGPKLRGNLYMTAGGALAETGKPEAALHQFQQAEELFAAAGERRSQAIALQMIGSIYLLARDLSHGTSYYLKSIELAPKDPALLLSSHFNLGSALLDDDQPQRAEVELRLAESAAKAANSTMILSRIYGLLASAQLMDGHPQAAELSVKAGQGLIAQGKSGEWAVGIYSAAAQLALRRNQLDVAQTEIEKAFAAAKGSPSTLLLRDVHRIAYEVFKARGNETQALVHLEAYKRLEDQARATAASTSAALAAARFDFANQNVRIAQLQTEESRRAAQNRLNLLIAVIVGASVISVLLLIGFLSIRRSRNQVRTANAELSDTNAELEQALSTRTQFLATTSHEIRTPLNGILGMTQVLLADRAIDPGVKSKIELVHGAGETMRALVDDILDVAKMTTGELKLHPAEMDLHRLLRDTFQVWGEQARTKGISLALHIEASPQRIIADEVRLRQIVFNLTANAVKFTDRGEVRLTAKPVPDADSKTGERLRIDIRDTGVGIPDDKLEEIFESFRQVDSATTRRHGGTGLGLAICKNLAKAMGGDITVASILGAGATFSLDVPLDRVVVAPIVRAEPGSRKLGDMRMLLGEANPLSQSILRAVLSPKVASFATAANADEARAAIAAGETDLLLLDANTLHRDLETAGSLAQPVINAGGDAVLLWPSPDEEVNAVAMDKGITRLLATPLPAPDLVAALTALYEPIHTPTEAAA